MERGRTTTVLLVVIAAAVVVIAALLVGQMLGARDKESPARKAAHHEAVLDARDTCLSQQHASDELFDDAKYDACVKKEVASSMKQWDYLNSNG